MSVDNQQHDETSERDRQIILELENQLAELQLVLDNVQRNYQDNQVDQREDVISYEHGLTNTNLDENRNENFLRYHEAQSMVRSFRIEQANLVKEFLIQKLNRELDIQIEKKNIQKGKCEMRKIMENMGKRLQTMEKLNSAMEIKAKTMKRSFEAKVSDLRMEISTKDREIRYLKEDVQCYKHQEKQLMRRCKGIFQRYANALYICF